MTVKQKIVDIIGKEKFEAIKVGLGMAAMPTPAQKEQPATKCSDYPMEDGNVLSVSGDLAVGSSANIVTDNNSVPAPDGDYVISMPDGTQSTVTIANGQISVITPMATTPAPTTEPMPMPTDMEKQIAELKSLIEQATTSMAAMKNEFSKATTESKNEYMDLKKSVSSLFEIVEKIAELPSETSSVKDEPSKFRATKENALNNLSAALGKLKQN